MEAALKATFGISFLGMLVAFPYYFFKLSDFARTFRERYPAEWEREAQSGSKPELSVAYEIATAIKHGKLEGQEMGPEIIEQRRQVVRGLYVGAFSFMATLFSFLGLSLIQGKVA